MEIQIDQESLTSAINDTATKAVASALSGYEVSSSIAKVVTNQLANGVIVEAIEDSISQVDVKELSKHLTKEIQRATTKATIALLHEGLISTICKLRGIGDYSAEDKKERAALKHELFG